jgi:hypothetical protein
VCQSYPPKPDIPRPDHLLLSAAAEARRARVAEALRGSESTEGRSHRAKKEAEEEASRGNSPGPSVELADTLLRSCRVAGLRASEKRKKSSPPGMNMLPYCHTPILLHANISHLQSSSFSTPARAPRNGNRANGLYGGDHCRGGHPRHRLVRPRHRQRVPRGGLCGEEGGHEEVDTVSLHFASY